MPTSTVTPTLVLLALAAIAIGAFILLNRRLRRQRTVREILDAADALEARLRTARDEIEAVAARDRNEEDDPVQDAMREMLRQRLWLRDHGETASLDRLREVRDGIDEARARIERQLTRVEAARTFTA